MRIQLGDREVGDGCPCYVVAEAGINANGDVPTAKRMIDAAADAGANAIKFQMRDVEIVYGRPPYPPGYLDMPRAHDFGGDQTQRGQKQALEFAPHVHEHLRMYAIERGLAYTVSAWDEKSLAAAVALGVEWLKVASPCVTDGPLMRAHGATGLPLVISTGGCNLAFSIEETVLVGRWGPDWAEDDETMFPAMEWARANIAWLHCCSAYPSEDHDLNLRAIHTMRYGGEAAELEDAPSALVGYSGHERGIATTVAAVALGACIVERHLTLDRTMPGSDQSASLEPGAFARMVRDIRAVESALGDGVKRAMPSEEAALKKLRRVVD